MRMFRPSNSLLRTVVNEEKIANDQTFMQEKMVGDSQYSASETPVVEQSQNFLNPEAAKSTSDQADLSDLQGRPQRNRKPPAYFRDYQVGYTL